MTKWQNRKQHTPIGTQEVLVDHRGDVNQFGHQEVLLVLEGFDTRERSGVHAPIRPHPPIERMPRQSLERWNVGVNGSPASNLPVGIPPALQDPRPRVYMIVGGGWVVL